MAQTYRRLVIKPPELENDTRARLAKLLSEAIQFQNKIATTSPHVLRFYGELREDARSFYVDHEPAEPLESEPLFDPEAPLPSPEEFVAVGCGIIEALAAARAIHEGRSSNVHGGVHPGVLLKSPDGIWKVSDFQFAPAICDALGVSSYLNLALRPTTAKGDAPIITGAWEVLDESEYERDDRICGFIDPEKYGAASAPDDRLFGTFESGSDVVAAGMLIALFAQHFHPYFAGDPEAHRYLDMSRYMGSSLAAPLRAPTLINSPTPGVIQLCDLLEKMLERTPKARPRLEEAAQLIAPFAPKIDFEAIAERENQIQLRRWLAGLETCHAASQWRELERGLASPPEVKTWPDEVSKRVAELKKKLDAFSEAERRLASIEADREAAQKWFTPFAQAVESQSWDQANEIAQQKPQLEFWPSDIAKRLPNLERALALQLKIAADAEAARKWMQSVQGLIDRNRWIDVERQLEDRPQIEHWPDDISERARQIERQTVDTLKIMRAQHDQAKRWLENAEQAARSKAYARALDILSAKPNLAHWPDNLLEQAAQLVDDCTLQLSDDVATRLQAMSSSVERSARNFVGSVLKTDFPGIVDSAALRLTVDSIQVKSDESIDRGSAVLILAVSGKVAPSASEESRILFEYDLANKGEEILDPDGTVKDKIVLALKQVVKSRREVGPVESLEQLRQGLFPNAQFSMKKGRSAIEAIVTFELGVSGVPPIEAPFGWDSRAMSWRMQDPSNLATQLAERISTIVQAAILRGAVAGAPMLASASKGLFAETSPEQFSPTPLPTSVKFEGRLLLTHPKEARSVELQSFAGEYASPDRIEVSAPWSNAEAAYSQLLVVAQNAARQSLVDSEASSIAGIKAKVTSNPKKIKTPTGEITLDIKAKGVSPTSIVARWNPATFDYDVVGGDRLSATPPAPAATQKAVPGGETAAIPTERPSKKAVKAKEQPIKRQPSEVPAESTAAVKKGRSPRRGVMIGGGVLVAAAVVATFALLRPKAESPQNANNSNDVPPIVVHAPPPESLSVDPATILASVDPDFANGFSNILTNLDGAPPASIPIRFTGEWAETSEGVLTQVVETPIGPDSIAVEYTVKYDADTDTWKPVAWVPKSARAINRVADWLRGRVVTKLSKLEEEQATDEARALHDALAPIFATWQTKSLSDALPAINETMPLVKRQPPVLATKTISLPDLFRQTNPDLASAVSAMLDQLKAPGRESFPHNLETATWNLEAPNQSTAEGSLTLWDGARLNFACSLDYDAEKNQYVGGPNWRVTSDGKAVEAVAASLVNESAAAIRLLSNSGELKNALAFQAAIAPPLTKLRAQQPFSSLPTPGLELPSPWEDVKLVGYQASPDRNEQTGYPRSIISDNGGRVMFLVSISPADPLWEELQVPESERGWRISYIDAKEWSTDPGSKPPGALRFEAAAQLAEAASTRVPSLRDWTMAAMKLRKTPEVTGLFDSLSEWCRDPGTDDSNQGSSATHWITGGNDINASLNIPVRPVEDSDRAWIDWLRNLTVTQTRSSEHDDDLVGLRTELLIYPQPKS